MVLPNGMIADIGAASRHRPRWQCGRPLTRKEVEAPRVMKGCTRRHPAASAHLTAQLEVAGAACSMLPASRAITGPSRQYDRRIAERAPIKQLPALRSALSSRGKEGS